MGVPALGLLGDLLLPIQRCCDCYLGVSHGPLLGLHWQLGVIAPGLIAYGLCRSWGERAAIRLFGARITRGTTVFRKQGLDDRCLVGCRLSEVVACMAGLSECRSIDSFRPFVVEVKFKFCLCGDRRARVESPGWLLLSVCSPSYSMGFTPTHHCPPGTGFRDRRLVDRHPG